MRDGAPVGGLERWGRTLSAPAGLLLVAGNGSADAYIYLERGHVFAAAMTGDLVLFAVGIGEPRLADAWRPLAVIGAFAAGLVLASFVLRRARGWASHPTVLSVLAVLTAAFVVIAWLPASCPTAFITVPVGALAGLQLAVARRIDMIQLTSTVQSMNLLRAVESLFEESERDAPVRRRRAADAVAIPVAFVLGAIVAAALTPALGDRAAAFTAALYAGALAMSWVRRRS